MDIDQRPPQPRKLPQQERSRRMVTAIIDACKKILVEYGEEALTLSLLETVSGVTKGSIYQYFPSLPAVVGALYERECRLSIGQGLVDASEGQHNLVELLGAIVEKSVLAQERLQSLHSSFYFRYKQYYGRGEKLTLNEETLAWSRDVLVPLIDKYVGDEVLDDSTGTASQALVTLKTQIWIPLRYGSNNIDKEALQQQLLASVLQIVDNAPRKLG